MLGHSISAYPHIRVAGSIAYNKRAGCRRESAGILSFTGLEVGLYEDARQDTNGTISKNVHVGRIGLWTILDD